MKLSLTRMPLFPWAAFSSLLAAGLILIPALSATAQTLERTIALRDGTVLQVKIADQEVPWKNVSRSGEITEQPIPLSSIKRMIFSESPATSDVAGVRRLLNVLGSGSFAEREQAQNALIKNGGRFKQIIEQYQTEDSEIRWRLAEIIRKTEDATGEAIQNQFDNVVLAEQDGELDGDCGDWQFEAEYAGLKLTFNRLLVYEIHDQKPVLDFAASAEGNTAVRLTEDARPQASENEPVRTGYTRIDFDTAPDGNAVSARQKIDNLYVPVGCRFRTEKPDTYVMANQYNCGGLSEHYCAAANAPIYQGVIRIDFCIPGKSNFPAGVKFVGFYIKVVEPDGTKLEAYDGYGQLITAIKTTVKGGEFLAIRSSRPIAYLRIVPQPEIDADFAIDDLYFDTPRPLVEGGDPIVNTVVLKSGDRLQAKSISIQDRKVILSDLAFTDKAVQLSLDDVAVLTPRKPEELPSLAPTFAQLKNGNTLAVDIANEKITSSRFGGEPIGLDQVAAIWSNAGQLPLPPDAKVPMNGAVIMLADGPLVLSQFELGEKWLTSKDLQDRADLKFSYGDTPAIYLQMPPELPKQAGVIRTINGETLWLGEQTGILIKSFTDKAVEIERSGELESILFSEVNSIRFSRD